MSNYHYESDEDPIKSAKDLAQRARFFAQKLADEGVTLKPVKASKKEISSSFWGQSWNRNLSHYSFFANQLAPGRTFLRQGAVIDLCVSKGEIRALVAAQSLYEVTVKSAAVAPEHWAKLVKVCAGSVKSLPDLLAGKLPEETLAIVASEDSGLFPEPDEIRFSCSCPDWTDMCVHVAAVLYGFSVRLDEHPTLLFALRSVDPADLVAAATTDFVASISSTAGDMSQSEAKELSDLFGIDVQT